MAIVKKSINGQIVTYDTETDSILSFASSEDYMKEKEKATTEILAKRDEFKQRGIAVVKQEFIDNWEKLVDNSLAKPEQVWYNGASIEAALQCMEKLSQGLPVEEAYEPLNVYNPDATCVHFGLELSHSQINSVTSVVESYHVRGQEFCDYRNMILNDRSNSKHR